MKKSKQPVVIWALDPFDEETRPAVPALQALFQWVRESGLKLQPVHVVSLPLDELERGSLAYVEEMQRVLKAYVKEFGLREVLPPELLLDETASRQGAVDKLLHYASGQDTAWIALSSHGRSGLKRFVFGSFAENVLGRSPWPVLFLPREAPDLKKTAALFPTDFSVPSHRAYRKFLAYAAPLGLEVVLFHTVSIPAPIYASQPSAFPSAYIPESYFRDQEARAKKLGAEWVKEALACRVPAQLMLNEKNTGLLTGKVVLDAAERAGAGIIAMASQSRPVDRLLLGSAAHEVFRANRYPVWMCGPKSLVRRKKSALPGKKRRPEQRRGKPPPRPIDTCINIYS